MIRRNVLQKVTILVLIISLLTPNSMIFSYHVKDAVHSLVTDSPAIAHALAKSTKELQALGVPSELYMVLQSAVQTSLEQSTASAAKSADNAPSVIPSATPFVTPLVPVSVTPEPTKAPDSSDTSIHEELVNPEIMNETADKKGNPKEPFAKELQTNEASDKHDAQKSAESGESDSALPKTVPPVSHAE